MESCAVVLFRFPRFPFLRQLFSSQCQHSSTVACTPKVLYGRQTELRNRDGRMGERRRSGQLSSRKQRQRKEQQNANRSNPVNTANAICESVCLLIDFIPVLRATLPASFNPSERSSFDLPFPVARHRLCIIPLMPIPPCSHSHSIP